MVKSFHAVVALVLQITCLVTLIGCGDDRSSSNPANRLEQSAKSATQRVEKHPDMYAQADENASSPPANEKRIRAVDTDVVVPDTGLVRSNTVSDPLQTIDYPWSLRVVGKRHHTEEAPFRSRTYISIGIDDESCDVVSETVKVSLQRVRNEITGYESERLSLPEGRDHIFLIRDNASQYPEKDPRTFYPTPIVAKDACDLPRGIAVDKIGLRLESGSSHTFGPETERLILTSVKTPTGGYQVAAKTGQSSQELLPAYRWMPPGHTQESDVPLIAWVGDLNKDQVPDFILKHSIYAEYGVGDFSLFVSSPGNGLPQFREMARARSTVM